MSEIDLSLSEWKLIKIYPIAKLYKIGKENNIL